MTRRRSKLFPALYLLLFSSWLPRRGRGGLMARGKRCCVPGRWLCPLPNSGRRYYMGLGDTCCFAPSPHTFVRTCFPRICLIVVRGKAPANVGTSVWWVRCAQSHFLSFSPL